MNSFVQKKIKLMKANKQKMNVSLENSFPSFNKIQQKKEKSNNQNTRYIQYNNQIIHQNIKSNDIKEIDIKNIPSEILLKNKINRHKRNKLKNNNNIPIKTTLYSNDNISDYSLPKFHNNSYTQRTIETYEIPLGKNYYLNQKLCNQINERENNSMDITYYKPIIYINKNENNNSFCKKSENSDFFTQNNSFFMTGTNLEENINIPNINLNNTVNYNKDKLYKHKTSLTTINSINSIPRPQKFRKKIPPIPIRKMSESNNNSFYFDENDINNNIYTIINTNKIKNVYSNDKNRLESTNLKTKTINKEKNAYKKYSNKTYSIGYIKNIEKIGIQLSFSTNKLKNESIDLISPEILKNLKQYSSEKQEHEVIYSDLDANNVNEFNNNEKLKNVDVFNLKEEYDSMRKKYYNKLSHYLLKNKKRRGSQKNGRKDKYNIIDIKEKIKEEKKNRSLSNLFKYKKREIIKDSSSATKIKKQNDIGGKIDLKIQSIKNKRHSIKKGTKRRIILSNLIKQCKISKYPEDKGEIIINAAKTIQKWWRDFISKIFIILNIIKIQSLYRSYIIRKNLLKMKDNLSSSQKKQNLIYRKIISKSQTINNSKNIDNSSQIKSRNVKKKHMMSIISNNSFKIVSNEELNSSVQSKDKNEINDMIIIDKKNMKLCFYTKEYFNNNGEEKIRFIQRYIKNYLNKRINDFKNKKIIKLPLIPLSYSEKIRYKNITSNPSLKAKPIISICSTTENNIYIKKKNPVAYSITQINSESLFSKNVKRESLKSEDLSKEKMIEEIKTFRKEFPKKEVIYQIPILNKICYINKVYKKYNDRLNEKINIIQNKYKNWIKKRKQETQKIFKKQKLLDSYTSKEIKNNIIIIDNDKITLIQKILRNNIKKRKEEKNKPKKNNITEDIEDINIYENGDKILNHLIKMYYIKYAFDKLLKNLKLSKQKYFLKMLKQRIYKIINQYVFQKLKLNDKKLLNKKKTINKNNNENNNSIDNMLENDDEEEYIFFFNTIKRHIKINEIDNNINSDNEIVKLLKENIPDYFVNYHKIKYIPYIKKRNEKNLINQQIYLFDDDNLAEYLYKCLKVEKNSLLITPEIIKKRLILEPLKNQNIFTITRYIDNLYNDYIQNHVCKDCYCKNNEVCLSGCKCHNMNNLKFSSHISKNDNENNKIDENLNINLTINEESSYRYSKKTINKDIQAFSDRSSLNSNINNIKRCYTFSRINNTEQNNTDNNENEEENSVHTEYNKNQNHKKINNFIRNFALRKKLRNSNLENINKKNEKIQTLTLTINLNNNLIEKNPEKRNSFIDDEKSNVYEEDIKVDNSIKKINNSLLKKKMKTIEPIPNHIRDLLKKTKSFRYNQNKSRKKNKETIKLRDSLVNFDYEYY